MPINTRISIAALVCCGDAIVDILCVAETTPLTALKFAGCLSGGYKRVHHHKRNDGGRVVRTLSGAFAGCRERNCEYRMQRSAHQPHL